MKINQFFMLLCYCLALQACGGDGNSRASETTVVTPDPFVFTNQGLKGLIIARLYEQQGKLYALTDNGLYQQQQDTWQPLGLPGLSIRDLAFIDDKHWLAAVTKQDADGLINHQMHETLNSGATWQEVKRPFGVDGEHEAIHALRYDTTQKRLYATGTGILASSDNLGVSWQLLQGMWGSIGQPKSALGFAPDRSRIWWGGQGAIENGVLYSYRLSDANQQLFQNVLPNPSSYYNVRFAGNRVLACGEGGIVVTENQGDNWKNLLPNSNFRFFFDVMIDSSRNNRIYTAGWDKKVSEPQPLILQWSDDAGQTWQSLQYKGAADLYGGVRSMILVKRQQQTHLYLGLYKGGVMQVVVQ